MGISFRIKLAEIVLGITAMYETTRNFCADYLTDDIPTEEITVTGADIDYERNCSENDEAQDDYGSDYLETLALYRKIVHVLLCHDVLLFHGSAISVDGDAYLFTATSGTGKSTHTALWKKLLGERMCYINDDKPLLLIRDGHVTAFGTPWDGKHHRSNNISSPVKAICILSRSSANHIRSINRKEAFPTLCQQSYRPKQPEALRKTLQLIAQLSGGVDLYSMGCNMSQATYNFRTLRCRN